MVDITARDDVPLVGRYVGIQEGNVVGAAVVGGTDGTMTEIRIMRNHHGVSRSKRIHTFRWELRW